MEFVDIIGYKKLYKINRNGEIWSNYKNRLLKPSNDNQGYMKVDLYKNGKKKSHKIHRLIGIHFIPNPNNLPCIDHINRIKTDNRIENLRWVNRMDNAINREYVDNRKGYILERKYIRKDGSISIKFRVQYILKGEYGIKNNKTKTFKTFDEAEEFRKQIYN